MTGFLGTFSRSCVLGKGFSRCEHLAKPFAFVHGHLLWPKYTIRPAKKDFLFDIDLQEFTKILSSPEFVSCFHIYHIFQFGTYYTRFWPFFQEKTKKGR